MRIVLPFLLLFIYSCSSLNTSIPTRAPAEVSAKSCNDLMGPFLAESEPPKKLKKLLKEKKLITIQNKLMQIKFPRLEWINKVKKSFNVSLKNWNNKRYPAFYLAHDEEVLKIAKSYASALEKEINNSLDDDASKTLEMVRSWSKSYQNYNKELNDLIEERISLQYNYSLLKKLDLDDVTRDIQLTIKKNGVFSTETITLHPEDHTYKSVLSDLSNRIKELDGTLIKDGKIKDRIVRQAMLQDMLTFVHRELEYTVKNTSNIPVELQKELEQLRKIIKSSDFSPSTYGVFKITDKVFISELMSLTKLDVVYEKFKDPLSKISKIFSNFFNKNATDKEKMGFFAKVYARIKKITPKQLAAGTAISATAGIGTYRYFWISENEHRELPTSDPHLVQLEQTQEAIDTASDSHSKVIEIHIDEEINSISN